MGSEAGRYKKAPIGLQDSLDGGIDLLSTILHFAFDDSSGFLVKAKKFSDFKETIMDLLMTIGIILLILWLLGLVTSYTLGGFIHILLVLAVIVILVRVIQGRRPIP
jgi:hypothetical protein